MSKKKYTIKDLRGYLKKYYKITSCDITGQVFYRRLDGKQEKKLWDRGYFLYRLSDSFVGVSNRCIREAINSVSIVPYNALKAYFSDVITPTENDSFQRLEKYFKFNSETPFSFSEMLEKHMVRSIRQVINPGHINRFIFTLVSRDEYIGKTRFVEWLFPADLKGFCMSTLSGRRDSRDKIIATKFLVNIDEFCGATNTSDAHIKSLLSQKSATMWDPFKYSSVTRPRITSFFATKNFIKGHPILSDMADNSRYLIFDLKDIDWEGYTKNILPVSLWKHALYRALDTSYNADLSKDEVKSIIKYNKRYSEFKNDFKGPKRRGQFTKALGLGAGVGGALTGFAVSPYGQVAFKKLVSLVA